MEDVLLTPPDAAEVRLLARGVAAAARGEDGLTPLQELLIPALFLSMTGHPVELAELTPISAAEFGTGLARRNRIFRERIVQTMLLSALVVRPLPTATAARLREFADALAVDDDMIAVAQKYADGAVDLAAVDFSRNGYLGGLDAIRLSALHTDDLDSSWSAVVDDPALAARWAELRDLPVGTLGRGVADFYRDRGFVSPGLPGSAPPLLAQHDWVHVLAGYGTTLENEIEVFAFMARANDDPRAFSLLAMVISLFETGYLRSGAGLFEANEGHLRTSGMAGRLGDAMRRGALTRGSHDFLDLDWFTLADRPITLVRNEIGLVPKSGSAITAGSVGPWQPGGITPYQLNSAKTAAETEGRPYSPWQPDPSRD
ncbi:ubiquinone biosynthesis protein COQ4 [Nocardia huaxiensis]|uniref:ubiquinone biosynthesis protein COQ4 n=1 Tax=Nocardia huaxiensis TaxID=2755382 RepID=UPI001E37EC61|nr:ubiquinone biosynthesis protein COQ4 [Nocardia huaxiensis]UFS98193.1 ubiquinone biosynthesis protein COQ4 [Nocardia huaxiensis]